MLEQKFGESYSWFADVEFSAEHLNSQIDTFLLHRRDEGPESLAYEKTVMDYLTHFWNSLKSQE